MVETQDGFITLKKIGFFEYWKVDQWMGLLGQKLVVEQKKVAEWKKVVGWKEVIVGQKEGLEQK